LKLGRLLPRLCERFIEGCSYSAIPASALNEEDDEDEDDVDAVDDERTGTRYNVCLMYQWFLTS